MQLQRAGEWLKKTKLTLTLAQNYIGGQFGHIFNYFKANQESTFSKWVF